MLRYGAECGQIATPEILTGLVFRLLRWVASETISEPVAEAKTEFDVLLDDRFGAA